MSPLAALLSTALLSSTAFAAALPTTPYVEAQNLHTFFVRQDVATAVNASLPNITIFATGGTIASQGTSNTQTVGYSVGLGVQQLISAVPEILNISNIQGYQVSNVDSGSINKTILLDLNRRITAELAKPEIAGVVVTHGTDTLEETAFFLDITTNSSKPIVVVGAMRPATALSADGPLNLLQAVTLASSPNARGRGVQIVLNDRIGSAAYTTKNNANSLDTFYSTEAGQLGFFINQVPYYYFSAAQATGKQYFNLAGMTDLPMVDVLYAHQDMDPKLFNSSYSNGARGMVFAGVGAGGLSKTASTAAYALYNQTGVPIVASHRPVDGFVPGEDEDFAIASGFYNPQKSRILLQLGLATGLDRASIQKAFAASYPSPSV